MLEKDSIVIKHNVELLIADNGLEAVKRFTEQ